MAGAGRGGGGGRLYTPSISALRIVPRPCEASKQAGRQTASASPFTCSAARRSQGWKSLACHRMARPLAENLWPPMATKCATHVEHWVRARIRVARAARRASREATTRGGKELIAIKQRPDVLSFAIHHFL